MEKLKLNTHSQTFEALLLKPTQPTHAVLFAAGAGGSPERHLPLLNSLAERGCLVIAPYFERMTSPNPVAAELRTRVDFLLASLKHLEDSKLPVIGIGHSIGATLLLALAGGQMWLSRDERFPTPCDFAFQKLVLLTPPTGFFQAPQALEKINIPIQAWAGSLDPITPPAQLDLLRNSISPSKLFKGHIIQGAGHFSFMDVLPPHVIDPMKDREAMLLKLQKDIGEFIFSQG